MEIRNVPWQENNRPPILIGLKAMEMPEIYVWQLKAQRYHIWSLPSDLRTRLNIACYYYWEKYLQSFLGEMFSCLEKNTLKMSVAMTWSEEWGVESRVCWL